VTDQEDSIRGTMSRGSMGSGSLRSLPTWGEGGGEGGGGGGGGGEASGRWGGGEASGRWGGGEHSFAGMGTGEGRVSESAPGMGSRGGWGREKSWVQEAAAGAEASTSRAGSWAGASTATAAGAAGEGPSAAGAAAAGPSLDELLSESTLFSGGAAINAADVFGDDVDGALAKVFKAGTTTYRPPRHQGLGFKH